MEEGPREVLDAWVRQVDGRIDAAMDPIPEKVYKARIGELLAENARLRRRPDPTPAPSPPAEVRGGIRPGDKIQADGMAVLVESSKVTFGCPPCDHAKIRIEGIVIPQNTPPPSPRTPPPGINVYREGADNRPVRVAARPPGVDAYRDR